MTNETLTADDSAHIVPLAIEKTIEGVALRISPLVLAELPSVLGLALPIFSSLKTSGPGFLERAKTGALTADETSSLVTAMVVNGGEVISLVGLCCRQPAEWVGKLLPHRAAELALDCLHVNADFFVRAMPFLSAMASRANQVAAALADSASAGPTPSRSS